MTELIHHPLTPHDTPMTTEYEQGALFDMPTSVAVPEEANDHGMELHEADPDERIRPLYEAEESQANGTEAPE